MTMDRTVEIKAFPRIHLGFIDPLGVSGRRFGAVGVYLKARPLNIKVSITTEKTIIEGGKQGKINDLIIDHCSSFINHYCPGKHVEIEVISSFPRHKGLGSGTQVALALGSALDNLFKLNLGAMKISTFFSRSKRSGTGYWGFLKGGMVVDGGSTSDHMIPPLVANLVLPSQWRFIVCIPGDKRGLHGLKEEESMTNEIQMTTTMSYQAAFTVLMQLLPSAVEKDAEGFGKALTALDQINGKAFFNAQKGHFSSPLVQNGIEAARDVGAQGVGQSSWGPSFYAFSSDKNKAEEIKNAVNDAVNGKIFIAEANNKGAEIIVS